MHTGDFTAAVVLGDLQALAPVAAVHGNVDDSTLCDELPERAVVEAGGTRIGVVHDAGPTQRRHERLRAWFPECELVVYGHTHWPEIARYGGTWIVNPGSPTERRRAPTRTMAVMEGGEPILVELG